VALTQPKSNRPKANRHRSNQHPDREQRTGTELQACSPGKHRKQFAAFCVSECQPRRAHGKWKGRKRDKGPRSFEAGDENDGDRGDYECSHIQDPPAPPPEPNRKRVFAGMCISFQVAEIVRLQKSRGEHADRYGR